MKTGRMILRQNNSGVLWRDDFQGLELPGIGTTKDTKYTKLLGWVLCGVVSGLFWVSFFGEVFQGN